MSNLSRRSLVTSAATLPALAVPGFAVADLSSAPDPIFAAALSEAWVEELKPEFDELTEIWLRFYALDRSGLWEHDGDLHLWDELNNRLGPITREILDQKPKTFLGLALQTQAFILHNNDQFGRYDEEPPDDERAERYIIEFACSVCKFLHIKPMTEIRLDPEELAAFKSDTIARLKATPIDEDNQAEIFDALLEWRWAIA